MSTYSVTIKLKHDADKYSDVYDKSNELLEYVYRLGFRPHRTIVEPLPNVQPNFVSINTVTNICEPWIELWGGDEWGESMSSLLSACHTSYGFSDEDCALFAQKLLDNLDSQHDWMLEEGYSYGFMEEDDLARTRKEACEQRDYWLNGGNFSGDEPSKKIAAETIATLPSWLFDDTDLPSLF